MELIKIPIGDKTITLKQSEIDGDIDMDEVTQIQYSNLYGEIVTVSALLNKIGILKADIDNQYDEYKLDCQIFESSKRKQFIGSALAMGDKKPTESQCEDFLNTDPDVIAKRKRLLTHKKGCDYINSIYWSVKSKDDKLSVLMKGVTPEDFASNIVEGVVNGFFIKSFKNILG